MNLSSWERLLLGVLGIGSEGRPTGSMLGRWWLYSILARMTRLAQSLGNVPCLAVSSKRTSIATPLLAFPISMLVAPMKGKASEAPTGDKQVTPRPARLEALVSRLLSYS